MDDSQTTNLEQIRVLVSANHAVRFAGLRREEMYQWAEKTLVRYEYACLRRIGGYLETGRVILAPYQRTRFPSLYTTADVTLLAHVDRAHGNLSGPATRRILQRE